jgi:hypothetical protein
MNQAGIVAILALAAVVLRALFGHVVILPGVVVPVAGLVFMALVATVLGFTWLTIRRARSNRRNRVWVAW